MRLSSVESCRRYRRRDGRPTYRLPTEAEWEYACRSGSGPSNVTTGNVVHVGGSWGSLFSQGRSYATHPVDEIGTGAGGWAICIAMCGSGARLVRPIQELSSGRSHGTCYWLLPRDPGRLLPCCGHAHIFGGPVVFPAGRPQQLPGLPRGPRRGDEGRVRRRTRSEPGLSRLSNRSLDRSRLCRRCGGRSFQGK